MTDLLLDLLQGVLTRSRDHPGLEPQEMLFQAKSQGFLLLQKDYSRLLEAY